MKTKQQWQSGNWLDSMMNVLLIVLTLGMLGVGAFQMESASTHFTANAKWTA